MTERRPASVTEESKSRLSEDDVPLEQQFDAAVKVIRSLPKEGPYVPSNELQLKFYSYFKQATEGACTGTRPRMWEPVKRAKWDAWNALGRMSREEAMKSYIKELLAIVETMSFTDNVAEFLSAMGPLVNFIDLEKVVGEEAARKHVFETMKPKSASGDVADHVKPSRSLASSIASHRSSSEAFFSQDEVLPGDEADVEDYWSTPRGIDDDESTSGDEIGGADGDVGASRQLLPPAVPPKAAKRKQHVQKPCDCKEILEKMRRDYAELAERIKQVESSLAVMRSSSRPKDAVIRVDAREPEVLSGDGSFFSVLFLKLQIIFASCRKVCHAKPNYAFVLLWPVLLQFAVLLLVRFYYFKF